MRPGYFKVESTETDAMIILFGNSLKNLQLCQLKTWLDDLGHKGAIVYRPAKRTVHITENGVSA
jgi:hypothetical protein